MKTLTRIACCIGICVPAFAHTPHHVIDALELSPDYENDFTVFVLVHNYLLRSTERGANWQQLVNGIDTPFVKSSVAVSKSFKSDDMLFVSTDGDGVFRSTDRGDSWQRYNAGLRQQNIGMLLSVSIDDGVQVLAAGSSRGLFASSAHDASWRRLLSDDVKVTAFSIIDKNGSSIVMVGDAQGGIWKSNEDLDDFRRVARLQEVGAITSIAGTRASGQEGTFLVGTSDAGLLRLSDDGAELEDISRHWPDRIEDCKGRRLKEAIPDRHIRDIKWSADGQEMLVTSWNGAVHVSRDAGATWKTRSVGLGCDDQADAAAFTTPHFRNLELGVAGKPDWFLASFDGLYRSEDEGESWLQLETMPVSLIRGLGVSPASDDQHDLVVTTYGGGAYLSHDQGRSWSIANRGLVSTRLSDTEFSPAYWHDSKLFALAKERLLIKDAGADRWVARSLAYAGWRRSVGFGLERRLGFSPDYGSRLFLDDTERGSVWPMQIELSPTFAVDRTMLIGFRRHGIWVSDDGGAEWDRGWDGPTDYVTDLEISPEFGDDGTVFAGIRGAGIYVSLDGADSWNPANSGFDYFASYQATQSPNHYIDPPLSRAITDVLLEVSPNFAVDQTAFAGSAAGVFRSADSGKTWQPLALPLLPESGSVIGLGISPDFAKDQVILVSVKGMGLFRSTDSGETFEPTGGNLLSANTELRHIRFSPTFETDRTIYGASDWELVISRDGGSSWSMIERPVRYEDWRGTYAGPVRFTGDWHRETGSGFSASTQTTTDQPGATAILGFVGPTVEWMGQRGPSGGMARVLVDGVEVGIADLYSEQQSSGVSVFKVPDLENKPHNVVIEVLDNANPRSTGRRVAVDNIDVSHP